MKIAISIFLCFVFLASCGSSQKNENQLLEDENLFILLKNNRNITLNKFIDGEVLQLQDFRLPKNSIYTTDNKQFVATVDTKENILTLFDVINNSEKRVSIPFNIKPKAILINQKNIFIGGELGDEMLVRVCPKFCVLKNRVCPKFCVLKNNFKIHRY